ncbi:hypothetical protein Droror1_Dr00022052 [Drosera rotundifolia]
MAFAAHQHIIPLSAEPSAIPKPSSIAASPAPSTSSLAPLNLRKFDSRRWWKPLRRIGSQFPKAKPQDSEVSSASDAFSQFKHVLLPITNSNPYLSEGTRQAAATITSLAKKYEARITVVVIDDRQEELLPELETQLASIRWHLSEGGFQEFQLLERRGEGKKPTAIIGEIADDMGVDLVVLSMEAIHSKHVDANLLAEFVPCPVLLLPL